jgi:hypothetical protein
MNQIKFPEIVTDNLVSSLDFSLEKCEEAIKHLELAPLDHFGTGSQKDKQHSKISYIERAIKNFIVSYLVNAGTPLIPEDVFSLKRWFKVAFPKDQIPYIVEDSMMEPDWETVKQQEDKISVRWVQAPYLVNIGARHSSSNVATIARLSYVGRRNSELHLKSKLPCAMPVNIEVLHHKFLSRFYEACAAAYASVTIAKYLNFTGDDYYSNGYKLKASVGSFIYWAPKLENIYTEEVIIPPPGDPILVLTWEGCKFFVGAWETNTDEDNLKSILDEFVI